MAKVELKAKTVYAEDTFRGQLAKRFLMNAFCSNFFIQIRLWVQVFLGAAIMKIINTVKANQA
jgi:hypothetical protein